MRTIPEAVEDIKSILNNVERTEECTGETLVDINELVDEILSLDSLRERKCKDCAGCTVWKCDCANERAMAIDEFTENCISKLKKYDEPLNILDIKSVAEQLKAGGSR